MRQIQLTMNRNIHGRQRQYGPQRFVFLFRIIALHEHWYVRICFEYLSLFPFLSSLQFSRVGLVPPKTRQQEQSSHILIFAEYIQDIYLCTVVFYMIHS